MLNVHALFADQTQFLKMTDNTSRLIKDTENFYISIGKIIDLICKGTKQIHSEHF